VRGSRQRRVISLSRTSRKKSSPRRFQCAKRKSRGLRDTERGLWSVDALFAIGSGRSGLCVRGASLAETRASRSGTGLFESVRRRAPAASESGNVVRARFRRDRAGDPTPPFSMSIPAETTRKKPQVRARRAPGTARRDRRAGRTRPRAGERDAPLVSRSIRGVPRCSSRSDRAWSARSGHDPMRDIGKCSRVARIFNGGTARDAPWRRRSGARRARGRGGRGDRRRRWQTS